MYKYLRPLAIFSVIIIFLLALLAALTYRERMLLLDPAWIGFNIINNGTFSFAEFRYGAFISQMFPLIASSLGISLKTVLISYSLSFYLFYLATALILTFRFRQYWLTILLGLYLTVFASDVFYWPNNELHQGIAWMLLFIGLFRSAGTLKAGTHILLVLLLALAVCSHLIVAIPLVFLWVYTRSAPDFPPEKRRNFIIYSVLIAVMIFIRYQLSSGPSYDGMKLHGVQKASLLRAIESFSSGQSRTFLELLRTIHWVAIPLAIASLALLVVKRKYFHMVITLGAVLGYYALVCLVYPDAYDRNLRFYMESEWQALVLIIATPLCCIPLATPLSRRVLTYGIASVMLIKGAYILRSYSFFHERHERLAHICEQLRNAHIYKAIIVAPPAEADNHFIMSWGLPVESILYSVLAGYDTAVTFKVADENAGLEQPPAGKFHSCFGVLSPYRDLNARYFNLDTAGQYHIIYGLDSLLRREDGKSPAD